MTRPSVRRALQRQVRDTLLNVAVASPLFPRGLRWRALRSLGMDVQPSTINARFFAGGRELSIGEGAFINYETFIDGAAAVHIGPRASLGPRVTILTGSHEISSRVRRAGTPQNAPVSIGEGAWIGAGVTILPGVSIGEGALVAAGAVVTEDVPANTVVAGIPARRVRELDPLEPA